MDVCLVCVVCCLLSAVLLSVDWRFLCVVCCLAFAGGRVLLVVCWPVVYCVFVHFCVLYLVWCVSVVVVCWLLAGMCHFLRVSCML